MRLVAALVVLLGLGACSDSEPQTTSGTESAAVVLTDATGCSTLYVLLVSADEQRALTLGLAREQFERINGPTELDLADLDASLLSGAHLSRAGCTDLPGNLRVDDTEDVDDGTLTITVEGGKADLALRGAASDTTTIADAEFGGVVVAPTPG